MSEQRASQLDRILELLAEILKYLRMRFGPKPEPPPEPPPPAPPGPPSRKSFMRPGVTGLVVYDRLVRGDNNRRQVGGTYSEAGWRVNDRSNAIVYELAAIRQGAVEFVVRNIPDRQGAHKELFMIMWDPTAGPYTTNAKRVHVQRRSLELIKIRWLEKPGSDKELNIAQRYTNWSGPKQFRLQWTDNWVELYVDGEREIAFAKNAPYVPRTHRIELGGGPRSESVPGVVYSELKIWREEGAT